jgi:hypothetical protein
MEVQKRTLMGSAKNENGMSEDRFPKWMVLFILVLSAVLMILILFRG